MAFDAGFTRAVCAELSDILTGAKVEKVTQPTKDELVIACYRAGKTRKLFLSANPSRTRICITEQTFENPKVSPMFCMLLRKHLAGASIAAIKQNGFERAVEVDFAAYDEMGFSTTRTIVIEIMGKCSNIMLLDDKRKILGVLKSVDFTTSAKRQVLPGMIYEAPPAQEGKVLPMEETRETFMGRAASFEKSKTAESFLLSSYLGLSPLVAREIAYRADALGKEMQDVDAGLLYERLGEYCASLDGVYAPTLLFNTDGTPMEYCFTDVLQYGESADKKAFSTLSELLDEFFGERDKIAAMKTKTHDVSVIVTNAKARITKKIGFIKRDLEECKEADKYKLWGDLITSSLYMITGKSKTCEVVNYYSEEMETVKIPLDIKLSASQNAAKYFKKYTKLKKAKQILTEQLREATDQIAYLETVETAIALSENERDVSQIKAELTDAGFISKAKGADGKKAPKKEQIVPLKFTTSGGHTVLCGKNNVQNDFITTKLASKHDWWFHVKNKPGSHVIMLCEEGEDPDASEFTEAAEIAAYYSSLRDGENVAVDYTLAKNVKKPAGSAPGHVVYYTNYTAYVDPKKH
ncbi:MAG: fibronectin/fibrinogen-binding protein [Ruminococcaceae bacterium]|nr:fibronectin/fibrinogen-binding protein [Oscillospiraceae bacterium]